MKSLRLIGLMLLISLMAAPAAAGTLGIFFDEAGTVDNMYFERGVPFKFHVLMYDMDDLVGGVEFTLVVPPELVILQQNFAEGSWPFYYQNQSTLGALAGVGIGLGDCYWMGQGGEVTYKVLTVLAYSPVDIIGGSITLDGFPGANGDVVPRYARCPDADLHQMAATDGSFQVTVPAENPSWGSVKALFTK